MNTTLNKPMGKVPSEELCSYMEGVEWLGSVFESDNPHVALQWDLYGEFDNFSESMNDDHLRQLTSASFLWIGDLQTLPFHEFYNYGDEVFQSYHYLGEELEDSDMEWLFQGTTDLELETYHLTGAVLRKYSKESL